MPMSDKEMQAKDLANEFEFPVFATMSAEKRVLWAKSKAEDLFSRTPLKDRKTAWELSVTAARAMLVAGVSSERILMANELSANDLYKLQATINAVPKHLRGLQLFVMNKQIDTGKNSGIDGDDDDPFN